jgi:hypothetical protein
MTHNRDLIWIPTILPNVFMDPGNRSGNILIMDWIHNTIRIKICWIIRDSIGREPIIHTHKNPTFIDKKGDFISQLIIFINNSSSTTMHPDHHRHRVVDTVISSAVFINHRFCELLQFRINLKFIDTL